MYTRAVALLALLLLLASPRAAAETAPQPGVRVIVLDAGHGGSDPGAHYAGVSEKHITLKVVLRLGKLIEEQMPGVKVVYTRKSDKALGATKFDDLQARADIANRAGGDLFLSVHVNASRSTAARGTETLIMGESSKEQRYNENALYENNRDDLIDMSDERTAAIVRAYIQNLQFTYGQYSLALANCIQKNYAAAGRSSRGVKPQLLRVLYATDMPGVLTEIGFLSNASEAAFLKSEKGIESIAQSLFKAIREYSARLSQLRGESGGLQQPDPEPAAPESSEQPAPASLPEAPAAGSPESPSEPAGEREEQEERQEQPKKGQPGGKKVEKVHYAVQLLASPKRVSLQSREFRRYRGEVREYTSAGRFRYKYCVGNFKSPAAAQAKLKEVRKQFPDAFVVQCRGSQTVK